MVVSLLFFFYYCTTPNLAVHHSPIEHMHTHTLSSHVTHPSPPPIPCHPPMSPLTLLIPLCRLQVFFGNVLGIEGDKEETTCKCSTCKTGLTVKRSTRRVTTLMSKKGGPPPKEEE